MWDMYVQENITFFNINLQNLNKYEAPEYNSYRYKTPEYNGNIAVQCSCHKQEDGCQQKLSIEY